MTFRCRLTDSFYQLVPYFIPPHLDDINLRAVTGLHWFILGNLES